MKKYLRIFIVILTITIIAQAQIYKHVGFKTGISISNQDWNYSNPELKIKPKNYSGFYFGMVTDIINNKYYGLSVESAYIQKGAKEIIQGTTITPNDQGYIDSETITYSNRFDYITLLSYFKIQYPLTYITPYILVGPRIDYMLSRNIEVFQSVSNEFEKMNYGISYGVGLSYYKLRYTIPFIEILSSPDINMTYETDLLTVSNYSYEIKFGFSFK